jgi:hypothetical protein
MYRLEFTKQADKDMRTYDEAKARLAGGEGTVPAEVTFAILDGANPIAVWRKHRNLSRLSGQSCAVHTRKIPAGCRRQ